MVAGNAICAFSVTCFALPYNMVVSGMSGVGRMVNIFTGASVSLVVAVLNIALFITGALILGKRFAATIALGTFAFPFFMGIFEQMTSLHHLVNEPMLAAICAGVLDGVYFPIVFHSELSANTDLICVRSVVNVPSTTARNDLIPASILVIISVPMLFQSKSENDVLIAFINADSVVESVTCIAAIPVMIFVIMSVPMLFQLNAEKDILIAFIVAVSVVAIVTFLLLIPSLTPVIMSAAIVFPVSDFRFSFRLSAIAFPTSFAAFTPSVFAVFTAFTMFVIAVSILLAASSMLLS